MSDDASRTAGRLLRDLTRWSAERPVGVTEVISAGVALGGAVAYGAIWDRMPQACVAAIGALAVTGLAPHGKTRQRAALLAVGVAAAAAAGWAGAAVAGHGWVTAWAVAALAAAVSPATGAGRPAAEIAARLVTFTVITTGLGTVTDPGQVVQKYALGAGWAAVVSILAVAVAGAVARHRGRPAADPSPGPARPLRTRLRYWRRSLRHIGGWQYTLRLTV